LKNKIFDFILGTFCHHLLTRTSRWKRGTTLADVVKAIVKHLDEPDPDYSVNFGKDFFISSCYIGFFLFCRNRQGVYGEQNGIQSKSSGNDQKKLFTSCLMIIFDVNMTYHISHFCYILF